MASGFDIFVASYHGVYASTQTDLKSGETLDWMTRDVRDPEPEGMTAAQRNQWLVNQARDDIVRYIQRKVAQNKAQAKREARAAEDAADVAASNF